MGVVAVGPFEVSSNLAQAFLDLPNPHGRPNSDVLRRWLNGKDITDRSRNSWVIDFYGLSEVEAALYEGPYEHLRQHVRPFRLASKSQVRDPRWWLFLWPRPELRARLSPLRRYIATPLTSKHRVFVWVPADTLVNHAVGAFAVDDDFSFGILQSRVHELWSLAAGSQLETRPRYTPTTSFETYPFPHTTPEQRERVGEAARRLVELRDGWLNPPGLDPEELEKRTLTNLYNQRPTWLDHAHVALDAAVFDAYGWPGDLPDPDVLEHTLVLNEKRSVATDGSVVGQSEGWSRGGESIE